MFKKRILAFFLFFLQSICYDEKIRKKIYQEAETDLKIFEKSEDKTDIEDLNDENINRQDAKGEESEGKKQEGEKLEETTILQDILTCISFVLDLKTNDVVKINGKMEPKRNSQNNSRNSEYSANPPVINLESEYLSKTFKLDDKKMFSSTDPLLEAMWTKDPSKRENLVENDIYMFIFKFYPAIQTQENRNSREITTRRAQTAAAAA